MGETIILYCSVGGLRLVLQLGEYAPARTAPN